MSLKSSLKCLADPHSSRIMLPWFSFRKEIQDAEAASLRTHAQIDFSRSRSSINQAIACPLWVYLSTLHAIRQWRRYSKFVAANYGVSPSRQLAQMLSLAWRHNVGPLQYYEFRFFDENRRKDARSYLPCEELGRLERMFSSGIDTNRVDHKLRFQSECEAHGLPTVPILGVLDASGRGAPADLPAADIFIKPQNMFGGLDARAWKYHASSLTYELNGEHLDTAALLERLSNEARDACSHGDPDKCALIIQPRLQNHPLLAPLSLNALNTLRVNTICLPGESPTLLNAVLRMSCGPGSSDTHSGGICALTDLKSGVIEAAQSLDLFKGVMPSHPDTGARIEGLVVPFWKETTELVRRAHEHFRPIVLVGWDVAITSDGPVLVEGNTHPRADVMQFGAMKPFGRGPFAHAYRTIRKLRSEGRFPPKQTNVSRLNPEPSAAPTARA